MVPEEDAAKLEERYKLRTDKELMADARNYDEMVDGAKVAIRAEFERRGLEPPMVYEWVPDEPPGSRPEPAPDKDVQLVTVQRYRDLSEAIVARSVLESAGILCFLQDENVVRLDWGYSNFIGGMRLQVQVEDEPDALELLKQSAPQSIEVPGAGSFEQPVCPKCGSDKVVAYDAGLKKAAALVLLGSWISYLLLWPMVLWRIVSGQLKAKKPEQWHCMNCGCNWVVE
jgi:hypothetical protein